MLLHNHNSPQDFASQRLFVYLGRLRRSFFWLGRYMTCIFVAHASAQNTSVRIVTFVHRRECTHACISLLDPSLACMLGLFGKIAL